MKRSKVIKQTPTKKIGAIPSIDTAGILNATVSLYQKKYVDSMNLSLFGDFRKPQKTYKKALFHISVPYLYLDYAEDYYSSNRGLFFSWKSVPIFEREYENKDYKKEMREWKRRQTKINFTRFAPLR